MTELFGYERDEAQGLLFARTTTMIVKPAKGEDVAGRRPGETAVDYRIRRQYRDVAATAPLFPVRHNRF